jgi:hypothetical protein
MRRTLLFLSVLFGAAGTAHADSRYFCSADDAATRFTVEIGFKADGGHVLNHFRGGLMIKDGSVPDQFKKRVFNSSHLTNRWSNGGELRMEIYDDGGDDTSGQALNMVVMAEGDGKAFSGTYGMTVTGGSKPFTASGKVSCGSK